MPRPHFEITGSILCWLWQLWRHHRRQHCTKKRHACIENIRITKQCTGHRFGFSQNIASIVKLNTTVPNFQTSIVDAVFVFFCAHPLKLSEYSPVNFQLPQRGKLAGAFFISCVSPTWMTIERPRCRWNSTWQWNNQNPETGNFW